MKNKNRSGFTLIELMVVIAIIGILAAVIMPALSTARAKGRDAQRISDIKQIQLALELYYDACGNYPVDIYDTSNNVCGSVQSGVGLVASGYLPNMPSDPSASSPCTSDSSGSNACYLYVAICAAGSQGPPISYHLGATLETSNSALANDVDATPVNKNTQLCSPNNTQGSDFYGLSDVASPSRCSTAAGSVGNAYPNSTSQETCFDVVP